MLSVAVKMLAFLEYRKTLLGSKRTPSSFDDGGEPDELDELEKMVELDELDELEKMDGDSCDAARTSEGRKADSVDLIVI